MNQFAQFYDKIAPRYAKQPIADEAIASHPGIL